MTEKRERALLSVLDGWAAIGPYLRLICFVTIILAMVWCAKAIFELIVWFRMLLG